MHISHTVSIYSIVNNNATTLGFDQFLTTLRTID